jgi:hypothetical protein
LSRRRWSPVWISALVERRGEDITTGIARVAGQFQAWRSGAPLDDLGDHLVSSVAAEPQLDDICVLAVGRPEPSAST